MIKRIIGLLLLFVGTNSVFSYQPLIDAVKNKNIKRAEEILDQLDSSIKLKEINKAEGMGWPPNNALMWAVATNNPEMVRLLLDHGANVNEKNTLDARPLNEAIIRNYPDIIAILLEDKYQADPSLAGISKITPLHQAVENVSTPASTVQLLLDKGAKSTVEDSQGVSPFMRTAILGRDDLLEVFLKHGDDPNEIKNKDNQTALMFSSAFGNLDTVKLLLSFGADIDAKSKDGNTAIDFARAKVANKTKPYDQIVALLENAQKAIDELKAEPVQSVFDKYPEDLQEILIKRFISKGDNEVLADVIKNYRNTLDRVLQDPYFNSKFKNLPAYLIYTGEIEFKDLLKQQVTKDTRFGDIDIITQSNSD